MEATTASIEQMSASVTQNGDNAKLTEGIAGKAAEQATEGGAAVQQTVDAMKDIAAKIAIIDDIAFQTTNLQQLMRFFTVNARQRKAGLTRAVATTSTTPCSTPARFDRF